MKTHKTLLLSLLLATAAQAQPARSCNTWAQFPEASGGKIAGIFQDVAVLQNGQAWAAGSGLNGQAMIQRFNGTSWQFSYQGPGEYLRSIAAFSPTDVWAVGGQTTPVILRYDGATWSQVPFTLPLSGLYFAKVGGTSSSDVWVVGYYTTLAGSIPLFAHYDGATWTQAPATNIGSAVMYSVFSFSANDAWAAGTNGAPILMRWNGSSWTQVALPSSGDTFGTIYAISGTGPNDIWIGGNSFSLSTPTKILLYRYNGSSWTKVDAASLRLSSGQAIDLSSVASNNVWMAGELIGTREGQDGYFLQRWDGNKWSNSQVPRGSGFSDGLYALATLSTGEGWGVGFDQPIIGEVYPLIRRYVPCR